MKKNNNDEYGCDNGGIDHVECDTDSDSLSDRDSSDNSLSDRDSSDNSLSDHDSSDNSLSEKIIIIPPEYKPQYKPLKSKYKKCQIYDSEKVMIKNSKDEEEDQDVKYKIIPPEYFIRDPNEKDIYCSTGIITPLTLSIAKKMEKMKDCGVELKYTTVYGQCCLTFENCRSVHLVTYGKLYIDNNLYKIPNDRTGYFYTTFPSDKCPDPIFGTGSGMDPVYLLISNKNHTWDSWQNQFWGNMKDYYKQHYYGNNLFRFITNNISKSIKIIGKNEFINIFNNNNRTHYRQFNEMSLNEQSVFECTYNQSKTDETSNNYTNIVKKNNMYIKNLKTINDAFYTELFKTLNEDGIQKYIENLDECNIQLPSDSIIFEIYIYITNLRSMILSLGKCPTSRMSILPKDIIGMINDRLTI